MIQFKPGISFYERERSGLIVCVTPHTWNIVDTAQEIWVANGADALVVTSFVGGRHSRLSEHYQGNAVDLRTRNLPGGYLGSAAYRCAEQLHAELGNDYTVILEGDHVHAHHEPGGGKLIVPPILT